MAHSVGSSRLAARVRGSYAACHVMAVPFVQDEGALLREWRKRRMRKEECSGGDAHHAGCFWQTRICCASLAMRIPGAVGIPPQKNCRRKFCTTAWRLIIPHYGVHSPFFIAALLRFHTILSDLPSCSFPFLIFIFTYAVFIGLKLQPYLFKRGFSCTRALHL